MELARPLQLAQGEALLLSRSLDSSSWVRLEVEAGIGRVSVSFGDAWPDVTLAFCGGVEPEWLQFPDGGLCQIEALTPMRLRVHRGRSAQHHAADLSSSQGFGQRELITEWLLDLHLVRHPVGTDARLAALLRLLVSRFGIRTAEGYRLPFSLGHARMAEMICATRSTVTRQLMLLRQAEQVRQEDTAGGLLLMPSVVQQGPELRTR